MHYIAQERAIEREKRYKSKVSTFYSLVFSDTNTFSEIIWCI